MENINTSIHTITQPTNNTDNVAIEPVSESVAPEKVTPKTAPGDNPSVILTKELISNNPPIDDHDKYMVGVKPHHSEKMTEIYNKMPNISAADLAKTGKGQEWINAFQSETSIIDNTLDPVVNNNKNTRFQQGLEVNNSMLSFSGVTPKTIGGANMNSAAVLQVRNMFNLGGRISVPLFHSGFWVTLDCPNEGTLIELNRALIEDKIILGRSTYGLLFSSLTSVFSQRILDFIINHIYDSNLRNEERANIRELISINDLPILIWGWACTIWPKSFPLTRPTHKEDGTPGNTITQNVSLARMLFVDNLAFTIKQKNQMTRKAAGIISKSEVNEYQKEFESSGNYTHSFIIKPENNDMDVTLKIELGVCNVNDYFETSNKWINSIISNVDNIFAMNSDIEAKNASILDFAKSSTLRQYTHFVKKITFVSENETPIEDKETISSLLDVLSNKDNIRELFFTNIKELIKKSTHAIIAAEDLNNKAPDLPRFPHLIPIDCASTFFIQLAHKLALIQQR